MSKGNVEGLTTNGFPARFLAIRSRNLGGDAC